MTNKVAYCRLRSIGLILSLKKKLITFVIFYVYILYMVGLSTSSNIPGCRHCCVRPLFLARPCVASIVSQCRFSSRNLNGPVSDQFPASISLWQRAHTLHSFHKSHFQNGRNSHAYCKCVRRLLLRSPTPRATHSGPKCQPFFCCYSSAPFAAQITHNDYHRAVLERRMYTS